jgi:integrase
MGHIYQRGRVYWIKFYDHGRPIRESTQTSSYEEARRLLKTREGAVARGVKVERPKERITVEEALDDLVNDYKAHRRRSLGHLQRRIAKHLLPFFAGRKLASITTADLRAFITNRQAAGASNAEVNRELGVLSRAFTLALQSERVATKPYFPRLTESAPRSGFFERDQLEAILRHLPDYVQPPVRFMYETGWRKREVLDLKWKNVDFKAGEVRLEPGTTKTGEGRVFPFTAALRQLLENQRERVRRFNYEHGVVVPLVFPHEGRRIWTLWRCWGTATRKTGLAGRVPHDFRRTACRNLIRAGVPEKVAMQMVGWRSRKMLDRYHIVSEGDLREAAKKLDAQNK